jgi:outer membrane protein
MKKWSYYAVAVLAVLVFITPKIVSAAGYEIAVGIWNQEPSGNISDKGESLGLKDELKYGTELRFSGRIKVETPSVLPNLYLMASPMKFEGKGSKDITFTFNNKTFTGGVPFSSTLRFGQYDLALYYGLPFIKKGTGGKFNVDIGIDARIIDFKAAISQSITATSESKSLIIPIPMIYIGAQFRPIKLIGIEAEGRGTIYDSTHCYDLIGRAKVRPVGPLFIAGGYRYEDIKIEVSDVKGKVKFQGPFAEVGVEF